MPFVLIVVLLGIVIGIIIGYLGRNADVSADFRIEEGHKEFVYLLRHARRSVCIATDFDRRFFTDPLIIEAIREAAEAGVEIRILYEGRRDKVPKEYRELKREGRIKIRYAEKLPRHVMVVDNLHVRIERPHPVDKFGETKGDIGIVFKAFPMLAESQRKWFDELWRRSS